MNCEQKLEQAAETAINKIILVRDYVHDLHEEHSLDTWWNEKRIFAEIKDKINSSESSIKTTMTKPKIKKKIRPDSESYWGDDSDSDDDDGDDTMYELHKLTQPSEIDPMKINYDESSVDVATRSVEFYRKLIVNSIEYLNNPDNLDFVIELYNNGNCMLWVLDQMPLTQYFVVVGLRTGTVAGNNTASENGIKWTKFYVNPERNRMKEKRLNALNTIHEKILDDDFNQNKGDETLRSIQLCKSIIESFDWTETLSDIFKSLKKKIKELSKYGTTSCMLNTFFQFGIIIFQ